MPNDLTAKRNLLNRRADAPTSQRQKLVSSGFTASIWTISGVVLAACSSTIEDIEEFLGLDDGGDGGGNALHVQRSPVQGARIYFDMDNDGVIDTDDITAQDEAFPQGFVTDSAGRAHNIPAVFQGLPFKAVLDGAIDADTGAPLSGEMFSIPDANGTHRLASPITDLLVDADKTPEEVVAELLPNANSAEIAQILKAINNPRNYLGDDDGVEGFAFFLATEQEEGRTPTHTDSAVQAQAALLLADDPTDSNRDTLIVVNADGDDSTTDITVTIGTHDSYVATIQAVSHAGGVGYRFVDADGEDTTISDFSINAQGVISFIGENPTTATLHIEVSNNNALEAEIVRVAVTVADAPRLDELPAGDETATIMENVAGGSGDGTALITGITTSATNPSWEISEANPAGQSAIADKFEIVSGTGDTFNLVLKAGEILNYDAIPGGVLNLHVWAEVGDNDIRSNALALRIQVEEDPDEVAFSGSFTGIVAEDGNLIAQGTFSVENQPENEAVDVSSQGAFGELVLGDNGAWTYTLTNTNADVDALLTGQTLIDTATISVGGESQNIVIRINGENEDVRFVDNAGIRTTDASVDVERGNPVLAGVDIFDGLTLTNAALANIEIDFAETGGIYDLFTVTDAGLLTFTGNNDDVAGFSAVETLSLEITAPTLTTETIQFRLSVNVINADDDGDSQYEIVGDIIAGETLEVRRISEDPDGEGAVSIVWYRGDASTPTGTRGTTYRVTAADEGETIGAVITYRDGANTPESIDITASSVAFAPGMGSRPIDVDEGPIATTTLATVSATSKLGEAVSYTIGTAGDHDNNLFDVNSNGEISLLLAGTWDYESAKREYVVEVIASAADGEGGTDTARARITFAVQDVNDNAPVFVAADGTNGLEYAPTIPENTRIGSEVARVRADDADGTRDNNQVSYSITSGNVELLDGNGDPTGEMLFSIDSNGVITLNGPLDFDTAPTSYTLEISASDGLNASGTADQTFTADDTATVTITLSDVNDEPPMVTALAGTIRTTEAGGNTANTPTGYSITVTDADTVGTLMVNSDDDRFIFERVGVSDTWNLVLLANEEVSLGDFTLGYTATDGANTESGTVTISAVDSSVSFDAGMGTRPIPQAEYVNDAAVTLAAGATIATVAATSMTSGATVSYAITGGADRALFTIADSSSGVITLANSLNPDYEMKPTYVVEITATDSITTDIAIARITIEVTNNQEGDGTYIVRGNVSAGAELTAEVNDPDGTRSVTYEWYSLDSSGGDRQVIGATQSITLASDADLTRTYHVTITHTDNLGDEHTETLQASAVQFFNQESPRAMVDSYTANPYEGTDTLPDVDAELLVDGNTATLTYGFLTDRTAGTTATTQGIFEIDAGTGAISLRSGMELDYEDTITHNLIVRATDQTAGSSAFGDVGVTITVQDVNEADPVIAGGASTTASISEDAAAGTVLTTVMASDTDPTNTLTYAITGGTGMSLFTIADASSGEITLTGSLDRETTASYNLVITVTDNGVDNTGAPAPRIATQGIRVTVIDVEDSDPTWTTGNAPNFAERAAVASDTETGFSITLSDDDTDAVNDHNVVVTGTHASRFKFVEDGTTANQWNLVLISGQEVDREAGYVLNDILTIEYQVMDGTRFTSSPANTVGITITDINDNKPVIPDQVFISTYASGVPESAGSGALFANDGVNPGVLLVNDDDLNQSFTYRIVSIDSFAHGDITNPIFAIQPTSGRFGLIGKLDYETAQSHSVVFEVTDQGGMVSDPKEVVITVLNEDEGDASYAITGTTANNGMLSVALDTNNPDPDGLVAGSETYRWFILNSNGSVPAAGDTNGDVQDAGSDDGDDATLKLPANVGNNVYGVVVTYRDNANETEEVTVIASAVQFTQNTYTVSFNEATAKPVGDGVADNGLVLVTASLNTNPSEKPKNYKFLDADGDPVSDYLGFTIGTSGIINFKDSVFDFDNITAPVDPSNPAAKIYTLTVRASYKSGETGIATVEITITDANDIVPDLSQSGTATPIMENDPGATTGIVFSVDDDDTVNTITYDVAATTSNTNNDAIAALFEVDKTTGMLKLSGTNTLNREHDALKTSGQISLTITAHDGVRDSNSETVTISVTDLNDNPPTSSGESGTATLIEAAAVNTNTDTGYSFTLADKDTDAVNEHEFIILGNESSRFAFVKDGTTANQWNLVLLAGQTVDREMDGASIMLNFQVNDESNRPLTALSTTVAITDANEANPTVAITSIATTQGEQTVAAGGVNVASFAVTDADATAYARANVELSGDSRFEITGWDAAAKTGTIRLKAGAVLDYETAADRSITLTITATDPLDNSVTGTNTVTITVTDENDNAPTATTSGTASLTEADAANTNTDTGFSITLADDDTDTVNQHAITIDDTTLASRFGFVKDGTTANQWNLVLLANQKVDREGDGETLTVAYTISDDTNTPITDSVDVSIIDANDEPTVIGATKVLWESPTVSGTIPEGSYTAGTEIASAIVNDADAGANLEYRLTKGGSTFSIGSTDGIITFTADTDLDADTAPTSYTLAYEVRDRDGAWEASGDITLTVTDIDDEKPEFGDFDVSYWQTGTGSGVDGEEKIRTIAENQGASPILVMSVSDPDTTTATLIAGIYGGSPRNSAGDPIFAFGILNNQAILSVISSRLDHETAPNTYTLTLVVNDGTRTDTETVTINVGDINDNVPDIVVADSTPSVTARTASADTDIITGITVTDADVGKTYAQGDFELTGDADNRFNFVWDATAQTGSVVLKSGSTIAAGTISLSLKVTDANPVGHSGTDTETLTITVTELVNGGTTGTAMQYDPSAADASGTLTYIDAAQVKANPVAGDYTATDGQYGTATVDENGTWTYNVDNTHAMVKGLASGATLTDTFTIGVPLAAGGTGDVDVTVTITGVTVVEGTANADTGAAPGNKVNRAAATTFEVIHGSHEDDVITVGTEGAVVFGGYGDDTINLRNGKTDIVVYRFSSIDGGSWRADDGGDIINNFERGRDIFILVDDDATPIGDLATFLSRATSPFVPSTVTAADEKPNFVGPLDTTFSSFEFHFPAKYDVDGPGDLTKTTDPNVEINWVTPVSQTDAVTQGLINNAMGDGWDPIKALITDSDNVPNWFTTDIDTHVGLVIMTSDQLAIDIL